jgi:predicted nucleic acid-binding protein
MILTPDNEYSVLLDSCVLIPMPLCELLLRLAEEPALYRPLWSDPILQEVGISLVRDLGLTEKQRDRRLRFMRTFFPEATVEVPDNLSDALVCIPDPNDRHVLAAAIRGKADAILTLNRRHFPETCLQQYDVERMSPDEFLVAQFHLNPEAVLDKLDAQASAIRNERSQVIARLKGLLQAPNFATLIEQRTSG